MLVKAYFLVFLLFENRTISNHFSPCLLHSVPILALFLFLEHSKLVSISVPLHLLFSLPVMILPNTDFYVVGSYSSSRSQPKYHLSRDAYLIKSNELHILQFLFLYHFNLLYFLHSTCHDDTYHDETCHDYLIYLLYYLLSVFFHWNVSAMKVGTSSFLFIARSKEPELCLKHSRYMFNGKFGK